MLKIKIKLTDKVEIEGSGDKPQEALMAVGALVEGYRRLETLGVDPNDYIPQGRANNAGEEFFNLVEKSEANELKLGSRKDGSGLFPHKELVDVWKPTAQASNGGSGNSW